MLKPWSKVSSRQVADFRIFTVRADRKISPRTGLEHEFYILDSVNWVNVVAVTPAQELVMVEQYRHGSDSLELEIPGGMMDSGDASPIATGLRELQEETGYVGRDAQIIGRIRPNPAILSNHCFTLLVRDCQPMHPVALDGGEDMITRLVPMEAIPGMVAAGKIQHSLVVVALYHFELFLRQGGHPGGQ